MLDPKPEKIAKASSPFMLAQIASGINVLTGYGMEGGFGFAFPIIRC